MPSKPMADIIAERFHRSLTSVTEIFELHSFYRQKVSEAALDTAGLVSGLEKMAEIARSVSTDLDITASGLREGSELERDLLIKMSQDVNLSDNFVAIFAKSDWAQIKQLLEVADEGPLTMAMLRASEETKMKFQRVMAAIPLDDTGA